MLLNVSIHSGCSQCYYVSFHNQYVPSKLTHLLTCSISTLTRKSYYSFKKHRDKQRPDISHPGVENNKKSVICYPRLRVDIMMNISIISCSFQTDYKPRYWLEGQQAFANHQRASLGLGSYTSSNILSKISYGIIHLPLLSSPL